MTGKQLRRLNRKALLEIMIQQARKMEALQIQLDDCRKELEEARASLKKREIALNEAGSIAVAALQLNGIFEVAQATCQQYVDNIQQLNERQAAISAQRETESRAKADAMLAETAEKCREEEEACRKRCSDMELEAKQRAEFYWAEVYQRLQSFYEDHQELKKLLDYGATL